MQPRLKELLTETPAEDGKVLFSTAAGLGEAIVSQTSSEYTNARSVGTLIGFMFRGKRSCPGTLRNEILKATRDRLSKQTKRAQDEWAQRVGKAIDFLNAEVSKAQEARSEPDEDQFDSLLERAESAEKHFIITPLTAEQEKGIQRAEALNHKLLKHLGIYPKNEAEPQTEYWFLLPNARTGEKFWEKLHEKALLALDGSENSAWAARRLEYLDKNNYLRVYIVPSFVCGCPIVIYDPDNTRDSAGFSFSHHRDNVIDTIRWDGVSISQWKENVFESFRWENPMTNEPFTETEAIEFMKHNPAAFAGYRCHAPIRNKKNYEH
jgi:hypothetical protein